MTADDDNSLWNAHSAIVFPLFVSAASTIDNDHNTYAATLRIILTLHVTVVAHSCFLFPGWEWVHLGVWAGVFHRAGPWSHRNGWREWRRDEGSFSPGNFTTHHLLHPPWQFWSALSEPRGLCQLHVVSLQMSDLAQQPALSVPMLPGKRPLSKYTVFNVQLLIFLLPHIWLFFFGLPIRYFSQYDSAGRSFSRTEVHRQPGARVSS